MLRDDLDVLADVDVVHFWSRIDSKQWALAYAVTVIRSIRLISDFA